MKTLRLLFTKDCNRICEGCCNKQFDLDKLPIATDYHQYDQIIITGGEPLLYPEKLFYLIQDIKNQIPSDTELILYTAKVNIFAISAVLPMLTGITFTIHNQEDVNEFEKLDIYLTHNKDSLNINNKSMRLNVFKDINYSHHTFWDVKRNIKWIKDCPLPKNEVFMKI